MGLWAVGYPSKTIVGLEDNLLRREPRLAKLMLAKLSKQTAVARNFWIDVII